MENRRQAGLAVFCGLAIGVLIAVVLGYSPLPDGGRSVSRVSPEAAQAILSDRASSRNSAATGPSVP